MMGSIEFPNPRHSTKEGLVAVGGTMNVETLRAAYRKGIFPWPQEGMPPLWFCPDPRGVLDFKDFHVPRSLKKFANKIDWLFTVNEAFSEVVRACQNQPRPGQTGTWIVPQMVPAYEKLHASGEALSLECWEDGVLVGGIYGVLIEGLFSGESMFHHTDNASKMALWKLVEHLETLGHTWMDIQMVTDVTKQMGGKYIAREEFLQRRGL
ncbi:MAG: leucyl/phenylalanyl-tRNA--protein transferase [Bdellovibrionaceae bacterium]|nr:leucyl/phenylalanyl-tRNA--protein transferase [Pseudobdellovibrionaceae bacterium]